MSAVEMYDTPRPNPLVRTHARRVAVLVALWIAAMAVAALWLDGPVARWAYRAAIDRDHPGNHVLKMTGDWRFTLAVALALLAWHRQTWQAAGLLALSALTGGLLYSLCKWTVGRQRPVVLIDPLAFSPFRSGWAGLFDEPNLSFPSGHTCLAFATAACLGICIPRWKYLFYALGLFVAAERIAENAHYLSDVIGGAGLGTLSAYLTFWIANRVVPWERETAAPPEPAQAAHEAQGAQGAPAEAQSFTAAVGARVPS
jgi:membrane-associated phospholipid phosphatase